MRVLLIAHFTLKELIRRRLFLAIIILSMLLFIGFTLLFSLLIDRYATSGLPEKHLLIVGMGAMMSVPAIWLVYMLSSVLTILMTVGMVSGEVEVGTFSIMVPKPLRRSEIVLGKWLCYALMLCVYTAIMFLIFMAIIYWKTGYWTSGSIAALGILELVVLVLLALTTMGSCFVPTPVNGMIALVLFMGAQIASFVSVVSHIDAGAENGALQNVITVINLLIPTNALWQGISFYLTVDSLGILQTVNLPINLASSTPLAPGLLVWVTCYIILLPIVGIWHFQRRDL